jgi:hypothetical protein
MSGMNLSTTSLLTKVLTIVAVLMVKAECCIV